MPNTNTLTPIIPEANTVYFMGYYVQDFDEPFYPEADKETGEVKPIDLHRVLVQLLSPIDFERWGVNDKGFGGFACSEVAVPLRNVCYVFGKSPQEFNLVKTCNELIGKPVRLDYAPNAKGKATLRGITPLI